MTKPPAKTQKGKPAKGKSESLRLPVNKLYPINALVETDDTTIESRKLNEIADLIWRPKSLPETERNARLVRAIELYESLKPADGAESMLAAQMVGTHSAALECLRRAAVDGQTYAGQDMALKHAQKLMMLYTKQLETLNKHRGKGQQRVTVEHVNVAAGGQAIVGHVETGSKTSDGSQDAIEHRVETTLNESMPAVKAKAPRSSK